MSEFQYKEDDVVGETTLDVIAAADKFNQWMYEVVAKHTSGQILEIGSGIGNISEQFLAAGKSITLTDIREGYCARLREKFGHHANLQEVKIIDLVDANFIEVHAEDLERYDCIFALNVVEHIEDDYLAIVNARKMLKPGGKLIVLVPAYQSLYNQFDLSLEHYRRYTKKSLKALFNKSDFDIVHGQYFNFMGIFGWYVSGKLMKNDSIPEGQMGLYNTLVPVFRLLDKLVGNSMGLSVVMVGQKK